MWGVGEQAGVEGDSGGQREAETSLIEVIVSCASSIKVVAVVMLQRGHHGPT